MTVLTLYQTPDVCMVDCKRGPGLVYGSSYIIAVLKLGIFFKKRQSLGDL